MAEECPLLSASSPSHTAPAPPWPSTPPPPAPPWPPDIVWGEREQGKEENDDIILIEEGRGGDGGGGCTGDIFHPHHPSTTTTTATAATTGDCGGGKVTFSFSGEEEEEEEEEEEDSCDPSAAAAAGDAFKEQILYAAAAAAAAATATTAFPRVPSYTRATGVLSSSSSTASLPMCRICHHPQGDGADTLISPCRCAGTMQFIHLSCLNKWLEVKRCKKAPVCELCNYQFHRHKKFRFHHWKLPTCSRADKLLHSIFLICLVVMTTCATITIMCFKQDRIPPPHTDVSSPHHELSRSEVTTLACGVLFFVAFFVAMYVEVKAHVTLHRLFTRFLHLNQTYHIHDYDRRKDSQVNNVLLLPPPTTTAAAATTIRHAPV